MIKKVALIVCAMVLSLLGLIPLCISGVLSLIGGVINIFLIFPLALFYVYTCYAPDSRLHRKRYLIGLAIVIANIFPVISAASTRIVMPWHIFNKPDAFLMMAAYFVIGFALMELGGWCFRKAHVGSPSPKARVAVKGSTLILVNAINLTMLAALAGLVSKGDTTWGYLVYFLSVWAVGTFLLALFIWFKPTWRWWIAMLPSIVILYVMPFLIGAHLNDRGEIVSPWNKGDDRAVEAPNLPDSHKSNNPNWVDPAARSEADYPVTPLMLAAGDGTPKEVKSQLARGIDIHAKNVYGTNALMYAALAGKSENIKVLLAAGARVNDQDDKGNTALSLARQQGHDEVVNRLVSAGAKE